MSRLVPAWPLALLAACSEISDDATDPDQLGASESSSDAATTDAATAGTTAVTGGPDVPTSTGGATSAGSTASDATTGGVTTDPATTTDDTTGDDTTGDGTTGDVDLPTPELPAPTMPCPTLVDGTVEFHPEGLEAPRDVRIWLDPDAAAQFDGPVVFYWHGTGGSPQEALVGLGELGIQEILDAGGIVVAPTHDPMAGIFPWYLVLEDKPNDLLLADEVLACAREQLGVDARRIYSLGFSAGGLHTAQMSIRRSSYLAAAVPYSGGLIFGAMPAFEDPANKFSAMIFHGGGSDVVVVGFEQASNDYAAYLGANDNFSLVCDHGGGHQIPDVQDSVMQFLSDHPYGTAPSPYAQGIPDDFPPYCETP